ncbi:MAG: universal stress protein, partial [Nitrosopumilaceae archaeon]|nr:universal stress protein [Nitrosopumilaceae archaeon]NIU86585.1 universal stress protein [Nitrosopumilaceae archaeon]NIV67167.1 universal stress protein [Nitrosopumilaceae archaeon]NIX60773.1 universal stress protein [Nitrosopumilaceae archaeon]
MVEKGLKKILVPLDGSDYSLKGLQKAIYLAELSKAKITVLGVVTVYPTLAAMVVNYRKYLTKKFKEFLESAKSQAEKKGINTNIEVLQGKASTEIAKYAKKENFDL